LEQVFQHFKILGNSSIENVNDSFKNRVSLRS